MPKPPRISQSSHPQRPLAEAVARRLCCEALALVGVAAAEAHIVADTLVEASLRGVDSHGLALLPTYVERIRSGQMHPGRRWIVRRDAASVTLCDGQHGLGPVLAVRAADLAAARARATGVGCVVLRDGNYVGALGYYARRLAEAGMVALAAANATPRVAPHGGRAGLHGTNPLAWAAPVDGEAPLVFDAATGYAAARVTRAAVDGESLPPGVALDAAGRPTCDAAAARDGVLRPVGGHRGHGLGLVVDLLTGGLAAAPVGQQIPSAGEKGGPYGCSFTVLAIDPQALGGGGVFAAAAASLVSQAHSVPARDAGTPVRTPGERSQACRDRRRREGIPVTAGQWDHLTRGLAAAGIALRRPEGGEPELEMLAGDLRNA